MSIKHQTKQKSKERADFEKWAKEKESSSVTISDSAQSALNKIIQEVHEERKKIFAKLTQKEWDVMLTALSENNLNIFHEIVTPDTQYLYEAFQLVRGVLATMKLQKAEITDAESAVDALETWHEWGVKIPFPENHAAQIHMYLLTHQPDPDSDETYANAWLKLKAAIEDTDIIKIAAAKMEADAPKMADKLKFKATGTALRDFVSKGWLDLNAKVEMKQSEMLGRHHDTDEAIQEANKAHDMGEASRIYSKHAEKMVNVPFYIALLYKGNTSSIRHFSVPLLPTDPKPGTATACANAILRLTSQENINAKGIDINHSTAINIVKRTGIWNKGFDDMLGGNPACHLILSHTPRTLSTVCSLIDYMGKKGINPEENSMMLTNSSIIHEIYHNTARTSQDVSLFATVFGDRRNTGTPAQIYRCANRIIKRLAANANRMHIHLPAPDEFKSLRKLTKKRAAINITTRIHNHNQAREACLLHDAVRYLLENNMVPCTKEIFNSALFEYQENEWNIRPTPAFAASQIILGAFSEAMDELEWDFYDDDFFEGGDFRSDFNDDFNDDLDDDSSSAVDLSEDALRLGNERILNTMAKILTHTNLDVAPHDWVPPSKTFDDALAASFHLAERPVAIERREETFDGADFDQGF